LNSIAHLIVAFMGMEERKLEMLFVLPQYRGKELGKQLLYYGIKNKSLPCYVGLIYKQVSLNLKGRCKCQGLK